MYAGFAGLTAFTKLTHGARIGSREANTALPTVRGYGDRRVQADMPPELPSPPSSQMSLRSGMHDLRNVLNAVQINAFAARQLVDDATRTLACIARIEAAVQRGTGVLQALPAEETLAAAIIVLQERLRDAGGDADVRCNADPGAWVPGLLRQSLCLVGVECQAHGATAFALSLHDGVLGPDLLCDVVGLQMPGPLARALSESDVPDLKVGIAPTPEGIRLRWSMHAPGDSGS